MTTVICTLLYLTGHTEELKPTGYFVPFSKIFSKIKTKTVLEFGVSDATKYFLDSCGKVISVEVITHGYGPESLKRFLSQYQAYSNWIPISYFSGFQGDTTFSPYKYLGSEAVYKAASYQSATHKNYALQDDFYLVELEAFIKNLVRFNKIDVAFVNTSGITLRGDLAQLLFGKVPVILAQDTSSRTFQIPDDLYGYCRMEIPENYEEIHLPASGTTAWILKETKYQELIEELNNYAKAL